MAYPESQLGGVTLRFLPTYWRKVVRIAYLAGGALRALRPCGEGG